jgi:hypothetical protein
MRRSMGYRVRSKRKDIKVTSKISRPKPLKGMLRGLSYKSDCSLLISSDTDLYIPFRA